MSGVDEVSEQIEPKDYKDDVTLNVMKNMTTLMKHWDESKYYETMSSDLDTEEENKLQSMTVDELKSELKIAERENAYAFVESSKLESFCSVRITGSSGTPEYAWGSLSNASCHESRGGKPLFITFLANNHVHCSMEKIGEAEIRINGIKIAKGLYKHDELQLFGNAEEPICRSKSWPIAACSLKISIKCLGGCTSKSVTFDYLQFTLKSDCTHIGDRFYNDILKDALWVKKLQGCDGNSTSEKDTQTKKRKTPDCDDGLRFLVCELDRLRDVDKGDTWNPYLSSRLIPEKFLANNTKRIESMKEDDVRRELRSMFAFQRWNVRRKAGAYIQITMNGGMSVIAMEKYIEFNADYFMSTNALSATFTIPFKQSQKFPTTEIDKLEIRVNGIKVAQDLYGSLKVVENKDESTERLERKGYILSGKCSHPLVNWEHIILVMAVTDGDISSKDGTAIVNGLVFTINLEDSSAFNRFYREYQHSLYSKTKKQYTLKHSEITRGSLNSYH